MHTPTSIHQYIKGVRVCGWLLLVTVGAGALQRVYPSTIFFTATREFENGLLSGEFLLNIPVLLVSTLRGNLFSLSSLGLDFPQLFGRALSCPGADEVMSRVAVVGVPPAPSSP